MFAKRRLWEVARPVLFFRRLGPLGLALTAYRLWRRLSPSQKAAIRRRGERLFAGVRGERLAAVPPDPMPAPGSQQASGAKPAAPLTPDDLTSPGTISDPELERRRAEEALIREQESREMEETKFEQLRREQEAARREATSAVDEPRVPTTDGEAE